MTGFDELLRVAEDQPLSRSLPRVLSAANKVGAGGLSQWAKLELMGYLSENPAMTDDVVVPEYRTVVGTWYDDFGRMFRVDDPKMSFVNEIRLRHGVAELEALARATGPLDAVEHPSAALIRDSLAVPVTVFRFDPRAAAQILMNIRVHLIDQLAADRERFDDLSVQPDAPAAEILKIAPEFYGVGVDLKALWRRFFRREK